MHTLYVAGGGFVEDDMGIQVWVNGHLVCSGSDAHELATGNTEFSLRNNDGKGSGCAAGYSIITTDLGRDATLYHYDCMYEEQTGCERSQVVSNVNFSEWCPRLVRRTV